LKSLIVNDLITFPQPRKSSKSVLDVCGVRFSCPKKTLVFLPNGNNSPDDDSSSYDSTNSWQVPETDAWKEPDTQTSITPVCDMGETCDMSQDYHPITKFYMR